MADRFDRREARTAEQSRDLADGPQAPTPPAQPTLRSGCALSAGCGTRTGSGARLPFRVCTFYRMRDPAGVRSSLYVPDVHFLQDAGPGGEDGPLVGTADGPPAGTAGRDR